MIELLANKTAEEKARIKGLEIAKFNHVGKFIRDGFEIEIISLEEIEGGIQVFAKAWKNGKALGFSDGSVEIERFRIFNPPILVQDINGDIIQNWIERNPISIEGIPRQRKLREDPIEAVRQTLIHIISRVGKEGTSIVLGKVGNTVSTFYPSADGPALRNTGSSWSDTRGGAGTANGNGNAADWMPYMVGTGTMYRGIVGFDTSSIPDGDVVSSAVFSIKRSGTAIQDALSQSMGIVLAPSGITTSIANSDYDVGNWTMTYQSDSVPTIASLSATDTFVDFTLNATGRGNINKTGYTNLGMVFASDKTNTDPGSGAGDGANYYLSETSGTTSDPVLVVTHAAAAAVTAHSTLLLLGV